jgi:hypothetical protein
MNPIMQALKNKITGTSVVDNAANPASAYSQNQRKMKTTKPQTGAAPQALNQKTYGVPGAK